MQQRGESPEPQSTALDPEARRLVDAARDIWIRRLLDHSRANTLLFCRGLQPDPLDLSRQPDAVRRLLAGEKLNVEALPPPLPADVENDPPRRDQARAEGRAEIRETLVALQRRAVTNFEEKGVDTLYLALGTATWPATDGGRPYEAPVLLVPARVELPGRNASELRLAVAGEPAVNPVLFFVLREHFGVKLSASTALQACTAAGDDSGRWAVDPESVLTYVEREGRVMRDFGVRRRAFVGHFDFSKMAMVDDLIRNGDALAANPVIAAVAGHMDSRRRLAAVVADVDAAALDERPSSGQHIVLDADSSQQRALLLAAGGQSGVVQGPPGTGKTQTVTNLVVQSVADGKRVLVIAQKRAALDAVIRRLNQPDVGLGHLVFDVHEASVAPKKALARVGATLEHISHVRSGNGFDGVSRELDARRRQLNDHARRINTPRTPGNMSVSQIVGRLVRLPDAAKSTLRLRGEALEALTPEKADEVVRWLRDGAAQPTLLLGTDSSPWNNAEVPDGQAAQRVLDEAGRITDDLWPKFEALLGSFVRDAGVKQPQTLDGIGTLLAVFQDAQRVRERYAAGIFDADPGLLAERLAAAEGGAGRRARASLLSGRYRRARTRLAALRTEPAPVRTLLEEARHAANVLRRWREIGSTHDAPRDAGDWAALQSALAALQSALEPVRQAVKSESFGTMPLDALASRIRGLAADRRTPYRLPGVNEIRDRLRNAGLGRLLADFHEHLVAPEHWPARFTCVWLSSMLENAFARDPELALFNGREHERLATEFERLDRERLRLAAAHARQSHADRAVAAMSEFFDQADVVRTEASKRALHRPLRELTWRAPDVMTRIAPCWLASPLSVSQWLDGDRRHFDLVIFDEASQLLLEEAVPALQRAGQVVAAGDRHQLPPAHFQPAGAEDAGDGGADGDPGSPREPSASTGDGSESVLGTLEAFLPNWPLDWHYRSEDERLMAFANEQVYGGRLVTFPSAWGQEAVRHVLVSHDPLAGAPGDLAAREAAEVVRLVLEHAETRPDESLCVVTLDAEHARRVQAEFDRQIVRRPELADFFAPERAERFFIKRVDAAQGDERDAVVLTFGYGRTPTGDLVHRFGALGQESGYRRLNVAVTRARRRMTVVSSFAHEDVDLDRAGSRGVRLLKAYLAYAAAGGAQAAAGEAGAELEALDADIRDALVAKGIAVQRGFGASRGRVELAALHPDRPGRPVLALECDGAAYFAGGTARDRHRIRKAELARRGWRVHRVWSTEWFYNREQEAVRAVAAYEEAVHAANFWTQKL